ncbi:CRISPR-associated protein Cas2 [Bacilli bacterium PM5-3]|nr:CRISPR-associated protein Cas2 [Bacilli bacterium PM5-3]
MDSYNRLKILCMFDLPTDTNEDKREYRVFRKSLLENGFVMIQYSIYMRTCPNREFAKKFIPKLKRMVPACGNVRLLTVTEKQYCDMLLIAGRKTIIEEHIGEKRIIVI